MVRRVVSLLLIAFQLTFPGLTVGHAHKDAEQTTSEDGQAPAVSHSGKFHLHFLPFGSSHHHHHHDSHHHHHDHDQGDDAQERHSPDENSEDSNTPSGEQHDENACHGQLAYALAGQASAPSLQSTGNHLALIQQMAVACLTTQASENPHLIGLAPSDRGIVCAASPLYLSTLHLLI